MPGSDSTRIVNRLRRIEGQVRGVAQMIEDDRYCIDVLTQMQAVKAALGRAESEILKRHAACCVSEAIESGDKTNAQKELVLAMKRIDKAAKTRVIHPHNASRKKSGLSRKVNAMA